MGELGACARLRRADKVYWSSRRSMRADKPGNWGIVGNIHGEPCLSEGAHHGNRSGTTRGPSGIPTPSWATKPSGGRSGKPLGGPQGVSMEIVMVDRTVSRAFRGPAVTGTIRRTNHEGNRHGDRQGDHQQYHQEDYHGGKSGGPSGEPSGGTFKGTFRGTIRGTVRGNIRETVRGMVREIVREIVRGTIRDNRDVKRDRQGDRQGDRQETVRRAVQSAEPSGRPGGPCWAQEGGKKADSQKKRRIKFMESNLRPSKDSQET